MEVADAASGSGGPGDGPAVRLPPGRHRKPDRVAPLVGSAVALVLVAAVAVVVPLSADGGRTQPRSPVAAAGTPSPSPYPSPFTDPVGDYVRALAAADTALVPPFRTLAAVTGPDDIGRLAVPVTDSLSAQTAALSALTPPTTLRTAHGDLLAALASLRTAARALAAGGPRLCTGGAALRTLDATAVTRAVAVMGAAEPGHRFRFGTFLPDAAGVPRPDSGSFTGPAPAGGAGRLAVTNTGAADAALTLSPAGSTAVTFTVYVRAGEAATATGIADGVYRLYVTSGADWDVPAARFGRDCTFERFDNRVEFATSTTRYTAWTITLSAGSGNATASTVDPARFPAG